MQGWCSGSFEFLEEGKGPGDTRRRNRGCVSWYVCEGGRAGRGGVE